MVRHLALLFLIPTLCTGAGGLSVPTNRVGAGLLPETSGAAEQRIGEPALATKFAGYVCGSVPACGTWDISDRSLDYGAWLAARLGIEGLARLPVVSSFYVEAGPRRDGSSLSLGLVSYWSTDVARTQAIFTALRQIPEGAFREPSRMAW